MFGAPLCGQSALDGVLEHGGARPLQSLPVSLQGGYGLVETRELLLDDGDDAILLGEGGRGNGYLEIV